MNCQTFSITPVNCQIFSITHDGRSRLDITKVCGVSSGTITVLAGPDGPVRTRSGGYIWLDPTRETD